MAAKHIMWRSISLERRILGVKKVRSIHCPGNRAAECRWRSPLTMRAYRASDITSRVREERGEQNLGYMDLSNWRGTSLEHAFLEGGEPLAIAG